VGNDLDDPDVRKEDVGSNFDDPGIRKEDVESDFNDPDVRKDDVGKDLDDELMLDFGDLLLIVLAWHTTDKPATTTIN
jgi:hypothetical protein